MITSSGIGSGLDIEGIVAQLVAAERRPVQQRLDRNEGDFSVKLSAFGSLKGGLSAFQGSLGNLQDIDSFRSRSTTLTNSDVVGASVSKTAFPTTYDIEVTDLARAHKLASGTFTENTSTVGAGTMTIRFGTFSGDESSFTADPNGSPISIDIDSSNNTLAGIAEAINEANAGVRASVLNDGTGYRLVVASETTGAQSGMQITVDDDDTIDDDASGLSQLVFTAGTKNMSTTQSGQDAALKIDGLDITSATNTLSSVIEGVTLNLKEAGTTTLSISENTATARSVINAFVDAYNGLMSTLDGLTSYNAATETAGDLLGEASVRSIEGQLRSVLVDGVGDGAYQTLADIGITTDRNGQLEINDTTLSDALSADVEAVAAIFANTGSSSDSLIRYTDATEDTLSGTYAVNLATFTPVVAATSGYYTAAALSSLIVDATNDTFELTVDGTASGVITLTQQTYADGDALAAEVQAQINADANLLAAGVSASVAYDTDHLVITSTDTGASSNVGITAVDTGSGTLGLAVDPGTFGDDEVPAAVTGTIGGQNATYEGAFLTGTGNAAGLQIEVLGGSTGSRGNVTYSVGLAQKLDALLEGLLSDDGAIEARVDGLTDRLDGITDERLTLDRRMAQVEDRLRRQFTAMDTLIAELTATGDFLFQQLQNLPGANNNKK